ncbi:MAG: Holliday junction resolvase RuvX [Nitratireductor sp.]|nr:Holliday junction resolvase RuvX [Nitratireductor sp.]
MSANVRELEDLVNGLPTGGRLMALDLGTKTIGVAVCDGGLSIATPLTTIRRTKFTQDVEQLLKIASDYGIAGIVIGLPLNMDGSEGPRAQSTRAFVRNLLRHSDLPVAFQDERLSTVAAEEAMIAADIRKAKRRENIDAAAAQVILQAALERAARRDTHQP